MVFDHHANNTFACLVAESSATGGKAAAQRRARVMIEARRDWEAVGDGALVFVLRVDYVTALTFSSSSASSTTTRGANSNSNNNDPTAADSNKRASSGTTTTRYGFALAASKLRWVKPVGADHQHQHSSASTATSTVHDYECSVVFSALQKQQQQQQGSSPSGTAGAGGVVAVNCIVTFERFLEARLFARQMHWLLEVRVPTPEPPRTAQACALVALPPSWWFEAWAPPSSSSSSSARGNSRKAFVLTSPSATQWTWNVGNEAEEKVPTTATQQQHDGGGKKAAAAAAAAADGGNMSGTGSSVYYSSIQHALPLMQNPMPTRKSDSAVVWAPCSNATTLASAMEGGTAFAPPPSASASSFSSSQFQLQPVPINSKHRTTAVAAEEFDHDGHDEARGGRKKNQASSSSSPVLLDTHPVITSRNLGVMHFLQPVFLDPPSRRLLSAGKNFGGRIIELVVQQQQQEQHQSQQHHHPFLTPCSWGASSIPLVGASRTLPSSPGSPRTLAAPHTTFVAVPLQEAIVEASSYHNNTATTTSIRLGDGDDPTTTIDQQSSAFVMGPATQAIGAAGRVLCVAAESFAAEPTPVVFDTATRTLGVLPRTDPNQHWASLLIEACSSSSSAAAAAATSSSSSSGGKRAAATSRSNLVPVVLLPLRGTPTFEGPSASASAVSAAAAAAATSSSSSSSAAAAAAAVASSSSSSSVLSPAALSGSSLESVLLLNALRNAAGGQSVKTPLHKPRAAQLTVCVVGSVGCGKSTLIRALAAAPAADSSSSTHRAAGGIVTSSSPVASPTTTTVASSFVSSQVLGSSGDVLMDDHIIFGGKELCDCRSCCSADAAAVANNTNTTTNTNTKPAEHDRRVKAVLTEAPAQSPAAMAGQVANADVLLCVVNCLLPHSLSWIEEKIKPLLEQRTPILSLDGAAVQYGGPTAVIVAVSSTSYRRAVSVEEITAVAVRLKCVVCELDFGTSGIDFGAERPNRLAHLSAGDARAASMTIGRCVQACASYARLTNCGWLPLHAEWVSHILLQKWDSLLEQKLQYISEQQQQRGSGDNYTAATTTTMSMPFATLMASFLSDAQFVGLDDALCEWAEDDALLLGGCPNSVVDCATYLAMASAARDLRGQLVKYLLLKTSLLLQASSSSSAATPSSSAAAADTALLSSSSPNNDADQPVKRRSRKAAKRLLALFSASSSASVAALVMSPLAGAGGSSPTTGRSEPEPPSPLLTDGAGGPGRGAAAAAAAASLTPTAADDGSSVDPPPPRTQQQQMLTSSSPTIKPTGMTQSAMIFLLSTFGVVVPSVWVQFLWSEINRTPNAQLMMRIAAAAAGSSSSSSPKLGGSDSDALQQQPWFRFLHLTSAPRHQSMYAFKQMAHVDFSFVIMHWVLEVAKAASSDLWMEMREGWLSRPVDDDDITLSTDDGNDQQTARYAGAADHNNVPAATASTTAADTDNKVKPTIVCRTCSKFKLDTDVLRCVVCERQTCIATCCQRVGGREADQKRAALLSIARTTGGANKDTTGSSSSSSLAASTMKQLPHVCLVCLQAHPAAPWQPDEEATSCYTCSTRFTVMRRRHHCRQCGFVVCGPCSRNEGACFGYTTLQRLCVRCFEAPSPFVSALVDSANGDGCDEIDNRLRRHQFVRRNNNNSNKDDEQDFFFDDEIPRADDSSGDGGSSSSADDDSQDGGGGDDLSLTHDDSTAGLSMSVGDGGGGDDPRIVFAPWAHLVLNSEPETAYRMPWYETLDEDVAASVVARIREMAREALRSNKTVPRVEYLVRQPGYLDSDKAVEDELSDWPTEFEPDES